MRARRKGGGWRASAPLAVLAMGSAAMSAACNFVVGVGDYSVADGSTADATSTDAGDGAVDASPQQEAAACVPVTTTPLPSQGGAMCPQDSDGSTCWPHDTTSFSATWVAPVGAHLGLCTAQQIAGFFTACEGGDASACMVWQQANTACYNCLYTDSTASTYGAIVSYPKEQLDEINAPGCVALAEPCNQPCAAASLALLQCGNAACTQPFCGDFDSYKACKVQAEACSSCGAFQTAAGCDTQILGAPAQHPSVSLCDLNATTFQELYNAVATFMCGP